MLIASLIRRRPENPSKNVFMLKRILLLALLTPFYLAAAEPKPLTLATIDQRTVTVDAVAIVKTKPEYIEWFLEIQTIQPTVQEGRNAVDNSLERLQAALKKIGIKENALVTSDLDQRRQYTWRNQSREFEGFYTSVTLRLKTTDFPLISKINSQILADNLVEVKWLARRTDREGELRQKALADAAIAARKKAEILATTLGAKVGDVLLIEEKTVERAQDLGDLLTTNSAKFVSSADREESASQMLEVTVRASIRVTFELVK